MTSEPREVEMIPANVEEKIIIVFDSCEDYKESKCKINGEEISTIEMFKQAIVTFLIIKRRISPKHKYALIVLTANRAEWKIDFTNDIRKIIKEVKAIESTPCEDEINLDQLFQLINDKIELFEYTNFKIPPRYVVRTIFTYGRSITIPILEQTETILSMVKSPIFFFDVVISHEEAASENRVEEIIKMLKNVDQKGIAHFYSVERDGLKLNNSIVKLLGHPLQRARQIVQ